MTLYIFYLLSNTRYGYDSNRKHCWSCRDCELSSSHHRPAGAGNPIYPRRTTTNENDGGKKMKNVTLLPGLLRRIYRPSLQSRPNNKNQNNSEPERTSPGLNMAKIQVPLDICWKIKRRELFPKFPLLLCACSLRPPFPAPRLLVKSNLLKTPAVRCSPHCWRTCSTCFHEAVAHTDADSKTDILGETRAFMSDN